MEAFPARFCKGIRTYWRRRKYQRLDGSAAASRKSLRIVKLGGDGGSGHNTRRRRLWRMRRGLRLRVKFLSPVRLLGRLKDAYVDTMLGLAGKGNTLSGFTAPEAFWGKRVPKARPIPTRRAEFERRMALEIYKSLVGVEELTTSEGGIIPALKHQISLELHKELRC